MAGHDNAGVEVLRFNLRSLLIATAWFAALSTAAGAMMRTGLLPVGLAGYLLAVLMGALGGTAYGVAKRRPEHNRWLRAFVWAEIVGTFTGIVLLHLNPTIPRTARWIIVAAFTAVPAFVAACLTDLLRQLIERYGGAMPAAGDLERGDESVAD